MRQSTRPGRSLDAAADRSAAAPPTSPKHVSVDDPPAVWKAVLDYASRRNALSWINGLELVSIEGKRAKLRILPGRRELQQFIQDRQLQRLAEVFFEITGVRLRPDLERTATKDAQADGKPNDANAATAAAEREARDLPLVKQVLDLFDAEIIHIRDEDDTGK